MAKNSRTSTSLKFALPVILIVALLTVIFIGVLPTSRGIASTKKAIVELKADIEEQKAFTPIFIPLQRRKNDSLPEAIAVNQLEPLKIDDLAELPEVFETLARESQVELVAVTPQVRSLQGGREMLRVDARMRGQFLTFNKLLGGLNKMKSIDSIDSFTIDVTDLGHEMNLSVWLAIQ